MGGGQSGMSKGGAVNGTSLMELRSEAFARGDRSTVRAINGLALAGDIYPESLGNESKTRQEIDRTLRRLDEGSGVSYSGWTTADAKKETLKLLGRKYYFVNGTNTLRKRG